MKAGETVFFALPNRPPHLYVALVDSEACGGDVVLVNLTHSSGGTGAFTLKPGDHPYITKDSDINFGDAIISPASAVAAFLKARPGCKREDFDAALVQRIAVAAVGHPATSLKVEKLLKKFWKL